jgi:FkbM family methyltransferase
MDFFEEALQVISSNLYNDYEDNWDHIRYGENAAIKKNYFRGKIQKVLNKRGYYHLTTVQHLISNSLQINKFEYLYNNLESNNDRQLLLQVLAFRVLGHTKVKLPLNTPNYWAQLRALEELSDKSDSINPNFLHFSLYKLNLNKINYPIEFYFTVAGILTDFIIKQYEYNKLDTIIKAEKGDFVIDGGGCWGDTALYFANEVGVNGRVFSFEFIPNNIKIFERNISLNKNLKENIELIRNPLWSDSKTKLYFKDYGPGSKVGFDKVNGLESECYTLSIDELVKQRNLPKVDFIKMDIEGAEINALKGSIETITKFKPKLAIALYHSAEDFKNIPVFLKELVPGYKFYFSHCSINLEESILFAKID